MRTYVEKLSLNVKVLTGFSYVLVLLLVLAGHGLWTQAILHHETEAVFERDLMAISHLKEAKADLIYIGRAFRQLLLVETAAEKATQRQIMADAETRLRSGLEAARDRLSNEMEERYEKFDRAFAIYRSNINQTLAAHERDPKKALVTFASSEFQNAIAEADRLLNEMCEQREREAAQAVQRAQQIFEHSRRKTLALLVLGLVGLPMGYFVASTVREPAEQLRTSVEALAEGKLDAAVPYTDYPNEIGAMARALVILQAQARQLEAQRWVKTQLVETSSVLQAAPTLPELGSRLLSALAPLTGAGCAVLYLFDEKEQRLNLLSSYGYRERKNLSNTFALGEGLVGQCAREKAPITISSAPEDYIKITSGLGESTPRSIALFPILHTESLQGVLEIATLQPLREREINLLDDLMPVLAANMEILERSAESARLLEETRTQAAQLDKQKAELKLTEEWYRAIVETAPDGMVVLDESGKILLANKQAESIFGYGSGEVIGLCIELLLPERDREGQEAKRLGFLKTGDASKMTGPRITGLRKDGTEFPLEVGLSRLPTLGGEGMSACASMRDITVRVETEEAIQRARDLAEEATRMKSDFLANMSHEIRTPMNAIIGLSHLVLKTELTARQRDYLQKIQGSGQHLLGIINDILDFSKIEAGKMSVEREDFELEKVLENVANLIGEKASCKGLELIFQVDPGLPKSLNGDSLRLGQILINYSNNAVKFTEKGEIIIAVKIEEETPDDVLVRFSVQDTGPGLSQEQIGKLFQSFQQADTSTSRKHGGTGLGLAICKQLANLMQGDVGVDSKVGLGSTFWFTARLGKAKAPSPTRLLAPDLRGRRVLVADDHELARNVLDDILSAMSFSVTQVSGGRQAVAAVKQAEAAGEPFEIVFLDWRMPGMNGFETARAIRSLKPSDGSPHLVMVTAYGREEVVHEAEALGIEAVIIKPVNVSLLFDTVTRILGESDFERRESEGTGSDLARQLGEREGSILLVEDNELNQEVALGLLADTRLRIDIANNGQEALNRLAAASYDLVLMDMQMPVMDGVTATREIRRNPKWASLPIIAMTANAMAQDREACAEAGMNGHVAKPIEPDELYRELLAWLPARIGTSAGSAELSIPGVDVALGLRRVLGKMPLYFKVLDKFVHGQRDAAGSLRAALESGDRSGAERIAHTLKAVCGNIGATSVQEMAGDLEQGIHAGKDVSMSLQPFETALARLLEEVEKVLPAPDPVPPALPASSLAEGSTVLARLHALLSNDDSEASDLLLEQQALLKATLGSDLYTKVEQAVQRYDFEQAASLLPTPGSDPMKYH